MKHKIIHFLFASLWSTSVLSNETITINDWQNNKEITEIRKIYKQIQTTSGSTKKKSYNTDSPDCSTYPIKEKYIKLGGTGKVRKLSITQLISHREPILIERFYDQKGNIRFVFKKSVTSETRIYLNEEGNVIWATTKDNSKFTKSDYTNEDWETNPSKSKDAELFYNKIEKCPAIK